MSGESILFIFSFSVLIEISLLTSQFNPSDPLASSKISSSGTSTPDISSRDAAYVEVNGTYRLCSTGCDSCTSTSTACTSCKLSYVQTTIISSGRVICEPCSGNCMTCSATSPQVCFSCYPGTFLTGSTCQKCDSMCVTCSLTATNCTKCEGSRQFDHDNVKCIDCPRNCQSCSNPNCAVCTEGFALNEGACFQCSIECTSCTVSNIVVCTACAITYDNRDQKCQSCPENCLTCPGGVCGTCLEDYHLNSNQVCVEICQVPCKECLDNNSTSCTACFQGFSLTNGQCVFDNYCNSNSSCTNCGGVGSNYILNDSTSRCQACSSISNCIQCMDQNINRCGKCSKSYHINAVTGGCDQCPAGCSRCVSSQVCRDCQDGYYLPSGQNAGSCLACSSPCLTCRNSATFCMKCVSTHTKRGRVCLINRNVGFIIILSATTQAQVIAITRGLVFQILNAIGVDTSLIELVTFESITAGSVNVTGYIDPGMDASDLQIITAANNLVSELTSQWVQGYQFQLVITTTNGVSTGGESGRSGTSAAVIVVAVLIPVLIVVGVIIVVIIFFKKRSLGEAQMMPEVSNSQLEQSVVVDFKENKPQIYAVQDISDGQILQDFSQRGKGESRQLPEDKKRWRIANSRAGIKRSS